uniref:Genome polyprotein n=1 Tax=Hemipteran jingmen-related virus TaxID=2822571 RepID=A0A8A6RKR9_9FLAV|nr:NS3 [Hemipteran jingmen-related virus]
MIICSIILLCWEKEILMECLARRLDYVEFYLESAYENQIEFNFVGGNSDWKPYQEKFFEAVFSLFDLHDRIADLGISYTEAKYLRNLEMRGVVNDRMYEECLGPIQASTGYHQTQVGRQIVLSVVFGMTIVSMLAYTNVFILLASFAAVVGISMKSQKEENMHETIGLRDGIYRLETHFLFASGRSIGVVKNGVLHACHHAVGTSPLVLSHRTMKPTYINQEIDVTCWFGKPQMIEGHDQEEAIINIHREEGQYNYSVTLMKQNGILSWPGVTMQGDSGSPVYVERNNELHLVALAGLYFGSGSKATEFRGILSEPMITPEIVVDKNSQVQYVTQHPGAGKTHKWIPDRIRILTKDKRRGLIIVSGPTRPVCMEIKTSLRRNFPDALISVVVKGAQMNTRNIKGIMVTAHATLMRMITENHPCLTRVKALIIDEAHVDDMGTHFIKEYGRALAKQTPDVYFLSATHEHAMSDDSNFPIEDIKINNTEMVKIIDERIQEGEKVAFFVPSIEGKEGCNDMAKKLTKHKPIVLNSKTYEMNKSKIDQAKLIITTNIAECGINMNVDTVVDSCKNFYYVEANNAITGTMETISQASRIQRRGRCGRSKPGKYYYSKEPVMQMRKFTAAEFDAGVILRSMDWYDKRGEKPDLMMLSREQINKAFARESNQLVHGMLHARNGERNDWETINDNLKDWMTGDVIVNRCIKGHHGCPCLGKYTWWDDRIHDDLVELKRGEVWKMRKKKMINMY